MRSVFIARSSALLGLVALLLVLTPEHGFAAEPYERAAELLASGELEKAAQAFEEAAASANAPSRAADSWFSAATLYEERLGNPQRAARLYRRIIRDYPNARVALASQRRLDALEALGVDDGGGEALAAWQLFLQSSVHLDREEAADRARALLREHADWSGRAEIYQWLGDFARERGDFAGARRELELSLKHTASAEERFSLTVQIADVALLEGDLDGAGALLSSLDGESPDQKQIASDLIIRLGTQRYRRTVRRGAVAVGLFAFLALLVSLARSAGGVRALPRALWPPPTEVVFMTPLAGLLVLMSLASHQSLAPAVATISAAGLSYAWVSGAGLARRRARAIKVLAHALLVAIGVCSWTYVAVERGQLIDQIRETVRFGPGGE